MRCAEDRLLPHCTGAAKVLLQCQRPEACASLSLSNGCGGHTLTEPEALTAPDLASAVYSEPSWQATISTSSDSKKMPSTRPLSQSLCEALHCLVPDL